MKSLAKLFLSITVAVTPLLIGLTLADQAMKPTQQIARMNMNAPALWTSEPVTVTDKLAYERVPGVTVAEEPKAYADNRKAKPPIEVASNSGAIPMNSEILAETDRGRPVDLAGIEACSAKYRSYRAEDNTYQPYGSSSRRLCELRNDAPAIENARANSGNDFQSASLMSDETAGTDTLFAHERWCQTRYASYDSSTDTYQPFSGPRANCVSPYN